MHPDFTKYLVLGILFKVLERCWKGPGNALVTMCVSPVSLLVLLPQKEESASPPCRSGSCLFTSKPPSGSKI